jgi:putative oxidoreductase
MMWSALERYRDLGLLLLRLGFGLGFVWFHGWPKIEGGVERWRGTGSAMRSVGIDFAPEMWGLAASLAESVGGLLVALGLLFRPAALAIAAVMLVATINHIATGQGTPAHAFKNFWVMVGLFTVGPGRYSLDHWLATRRQR